MVGIGVVERGALADLELSDVGDELGGAGEDGVETLAAVLENGGLLLGRGGFEGDFGEEVEATGGEPGMGDEGTGAEGEQIVVYVVDDLVDQLLGQHRSQSR
jgi:hypothetical protein